MQDTPESTVPGFGPTRALGEGWIAQRVPFHDSMSDVSFWGRGAGPIVELSWKEPTATHEVGEAHDTPDKLDAVLDAGSLHPAQRRDADAVAFGEGRSSHALPFHISTNVSRCCALTKLPTAKHRLGDVHETALSAVCVAPPGDGIGVASHRPPFQT